ncbi:MAG: aromatic amino acid lyase [Gaiellaceae bacterium MAG52_C11]|nr:aromatic amino acid lyase [Candidatus Gaiellasilicea maunaloa]
MPTELTGHGLTLETIVSVARERSAVTLHPEAVVRIEAGRAVVERYLAEGRDAYGLTTGLGARVGIRVAEAALADVSLHTIRGRANAVGPQLPADAVRAAMLVRANGIAGGGSGARPEVAHALLALLNAGVEPVVPGIGSVGAGDLCVLAHVGLALIGEGEAQFGETVVPAREALARAGLSPLELGPKDGLALINATAVSAGCGALALHDALELLEAAQIAAALAFEGFRASLTPIDPRVAAARPAPGQASCATGLRELLAGGTLTRPGAARRLQDPLSFRCASQVHGSLAAALDLLAAALEPEVNGAGDNPMVLAEDGEIVSTGNFHTPALALAADAVALGLAQVGNLAAARSARLLVEPLTGLPANLAAPGTSGAGMAPLLKVADALAGELVHAAAPTCLDARGGSDAVEDDSTGSLLAVRRLATMVERLRLLVALQLVVAARAVELARPEPLGHGTAAAYAVVSELVEPLTDDRPLGVDVERVATAGLASGRLRAAVRRALA